MDSGRSWTVALACAWINVFTFAVVRSGAVVYASLLRTFPLTTREQASWPVNLTVACFFLTGAIVGVLARYIAIWKLTLVGCLGSSVAVSACFFAQSILFLNVFLGFIHVAALDFPPHVSAGKQVRYSWLLLIYGAAILNSVAGIIFQHISQLKTGTCIAVVVLFNVLINQHFSKYRVMASGIANTGFSVGSLIFPPVIQALEDEYGIRGALLISGAAMLNSVAGAFFQRTPAPQTQMGEVAQDISCAAAKKGVSVNDSDDISAVIGQSQEFEETQCSNCSHHNDVPRIHDYDGNLEQWFMKVEPLTEDEHRADGRYISSVKGDAANGDADPCRPRGNSFLQEQPESSTAPAQKSLVQKTFMNRDTTKPCEGFFLSFLFLPKFYLLLFSFSTVYFNMVTYMTVAVDFGVDLGIPAWNAVYLILIYSVADMLARVGSGWITDRNYLQESTIMGLHFALWGAALYLMPMYSSYSYQVTLSIVSGWCNGSTLILVPVLFMKLVGIEKLSVCFGIGTSFVGLVGLARPLLIGFYRDTHGDYEGLFRLVGGVTMCISLLWLFSYVRQRFLSRKKELYHRETGQG